MTDPCGGNVRGGEGCSCVPPFAPDQTQGDDQRVDGSVVGRDDHEPQNRSEPHAKFRAEVSAMLADVYTPRGVAIWWLSPNRNLGRRRPIDMLTFAQDRYRVRAEAQRLAGGAW